MNVNFFMTKSLFNYLCFLKVFISYSFAFSIFLSRSLSTFLSFQTFLTFSFPVNWLYMELRKTFHKLKRQRSVWEFQTLVLIKQNFYQQRTDILLSGKYVKTQFRFFFEILLNFCRWMVITLFMRTSNFYAYHGIVLNVLSNNFDCGDQLLHLVRRLSAGT